MEFDDPRLEAIDDAPTLSSLADFHRDEDVDYWCVWRYKGMEVRLVMDGNYVERVTFICNSPKPHNTLCFFSLMQHIGRIMPPSMVITNFNSRDGFIIKYIYNRFSDHIAAITQAPFGICEMDEDEQDELLDHIYERMRWTYHTKEQLC